jgi:cytochrome P450
MLQSWKASPSPIRRTSKDTRTFSLHVLSGAGFGRRYSFQKSAEPPKPGHVFNYRDSLSLILKNSLLIVILGPKFLSNKFLPQSLARLGRACVDFKYYMTEMVEEEKESIAQGKDGGANITNALIRASQEVSQSSRSANSKVFNGLTEQEIYGNIFVYNFAGHDTTALTLCCAIHLLAAFPEVQDWMAEEINAVIQQDDFSTWNYQEVYPKLNRCLAVIVSNVIYLLTFYLLILVRMNGR